METKQFVVGNADAPTAGQTTFSAEFLKDCQIHFMIVNNNVENQLGTTPDFTHSYVEGIVSRGGNVWNLGDKVIIIYSSCKNY